MGWWWWSWWSGGLEVENLNWTETCRLSEVGNLVGKPGRARVKNHRLIESWHCGKNRSLLNGWFKCHSLVCSSEFLSLQAVQKFSAYQCGDKPLIHIIISEIILVIITLLLWPLFTSCFVLFLGNAWIPLSRLRQKLAPHDEDIDQWWERKRMQQQFYFDAIDSIYANYLAKSYTLK